MTSLLLAGVGVMISTSTTNAVINGKPMDDDRQLDAVCAVSHTNWLGIAVGAGQPKHQNNWYGCGTLVSPRHVITARHLLPKNLSQIKRGQMAVRFRRGPDGSLGSLEKGPDSYTQVRVMRWHVPRQGDIALGVLERKIDHIKPMPILWNLPADQPFNGFIAGWGSENTIIGKPGPRRGLRAGPNVLMRKGNSIRLLQFPVERKETGKTKDGKPIMQNIAKPGDIAMPNMHDSGGAFFAALTNGKLALVGVITTFQSGPWLGQYAEDADFPLKGWATAKPD